MHVRARDEVAVRAHRRAFVEPAGPVQRELHELGERNRPALGDGAPDGALGLGVIGAVVLCVPAALRHAMDGTLGWSAHGYLPWAVAVVAVASAEEALLRGSLYRAVDQRAGAVAAIALTSVAFALLHVPLYGWAVVPLDLAVGVWLGVLRAVTGSAVAPAVAHSLADLAGWWLR